MENEKRIQSIIEVHEVQMVLGQNVNSAGHLENLNMQQLQIVFLRVEENKKKLKEIKSNYKDALAESIEYKSIIEQLKTLREKKKQIEKHTQEVMSSEITKMEDLKIDIQSDMEMLSDIAITQLMKGETIKVENEYEQEFEPRIKVNFKKI